MSESTSNLPAISMNDMDLSEASPQLRQQLENFLRSVDTRIRAAAVPPAAPPPTGPDPTWYNPETHDRSTSKAMEINRDAPTAAPEIPLSEDGPWISFGRRGLYIRESGGSVFCVNGSWIDPEAERAKG